MSDATEQPFKLSIPDSELDLLRRKLDLARLPDELDEAGWEYGVPLADIRRLLARWKDSFDWRKAEAAMNEFPQFTRNIEVDGFGTLNIHYIHQKSTVENAVPLLFVHGWPGHFLEVRKMLPLLTTVSPVHPSFHVVALSLPGYGFSEAPKKKGFAGDQYAEVANKLMLALGYREYVVQGGDWGSLIARTLAARYGGKSVKAWHTNFPLGHPPKFTSHPRLFLSHLFSPYSAAEQSGLARTLQFRAKGAAYFQEQSTQPQTIGYSLADSPIGLLGWIYEKLVQWTDSYPWEDDEVLEWVSIYWFSRAGPTASVRIYFETTQGAKFYWGLILPGVPSRAGFPSSPKSISLFPEHGHAHSAMSCSSRNTRVGDTLQRMRFPMNSSGLFAKCLLRADPRMVLCKVRAVMRERRIVDNVLFDLWEFVLMQKIRSDSCSNNGLLVDWRTGGPVIA
ncbi:putative epoxide hydrolase [Grifola frondosa]|uniref:Putative epoxide hydrolase n=1 Tax=Grifola frondosa TaxID=5627 RepID=A0A1C7M7V4_GRIFR|nr:putative epoxide hydrolase [Grifola frondosa]